MGSSRCAHWVEQRRHGLVPAVDLFDEVAASGSRSMFTSLAMPASSSCSFSRRLAAPGGGVHRQFVHARLNARRPFGLPRQPPDATGSAGVVATVETAMVGSRRPHRCLRWVCSSPGPAPASPRHPWRPRDRLAGPSQVSRTGRRPLSTPRPPRAGRQPCPGRRRALRAPTIATRDKATRWNPRLRAASTRCISHADDIPEHRLRTISPLP